jgi:hypothetical protein
MVPLTDAQSAALLADLAKIGFTLGERPRGSSPRAEGPREAAE